MQPIDVPDLLPPANRARLQQAQRLDTPMGQGRIVWHAWGERRAGVAPLVLFHGGSGSPQNQIREAISYGAIKMNIDTDLQWSFWEGVLGFYKKNEAYMQGQLGNPEGKDKPNKKYYDPRVWLRKGEETFIKRLEVAFDDLNCINRNA